jgi:hypothetical protein
MTAQVMLASRLSVQDALEGAFVQAFVLGWRVRVEQERIAAEAGEPA